MTEDIKDDTTEVIDPTPDDDTTVIDDKTDETKKDDDTTLSDADKDTQAIVSVLDEYNLNSPEQLKDFIENMSDLENKIGNEDLEELKENSALLKKYQKHWEKEEERKREEDETPEETIARLKKDKENLKKANQAERARQEEAEQAKELLGEFGVTVKSAIEANKDVPVEYRPFLSEFLGVDNAINEVDLGDKAAIKKVAKSAAKTLMKFEQIAIKRYKKGKTEVPDITPATETTPSKKPIKNLKEASKAAVAHLKAKWKTD